MKRKVLVRSLLLTLAIAGFAGVVQAQDLNEAKEAYNNALQLASDDPSAAIASAKECLEICKKLGEEGTEVKVLAENLLPGLYFNVGNNLVKDKKVVQSIPAYQEALKVAEQYKNQEFIVKSKAMLPKLYNSVGGSHFKNDDNEKALEALTQAVVYDPDYAKAYYTMGLVYKKMEDIENFETSMDKGLVAAGNSKDANTASLINKAASTFFLATGTKLLAESKASVAAPLLTKVLKYDPQSVDAYFFLSSAYNELKQFDQAIETANKGLELESTEAEKQAKHYYNLGQSYKGKGEKAAACEAFNKALYGQFLENAKYEIEHGLKCNE